MDVIKTLLYKVDMYDLVSKYTKLSMMNGIYRGKCPIHHGDNPTSFCLIDDRYYCHSCGATGNAINFYSEMEGLPFYQSVEKLCDIFEVDTNNEDYQRQKNIFKDNVIKASRYHKNVEKAIEYLTKKRGLSEAMVEEFQIGFDDGGFLGVDSSGIIVPIQDTYGRIVGFSKRRLDGQKPKYKNTLESEVFHKRQLLFNYHRAVKMIKQTNTLHIVEGYFDVISAHQEGIPCVGYLGGSLTREQIGLLSELQSLHKNITFILSVDNINVDDTGRRMLVKMRDSIMKYAPDLNVRCTVYPA